MKQLTRPELDEWKRRWAGDVNFKIEQDGVSIGPHLFRYGVEWRSLFIAFRYRNMHGILHADNGYLGRRPDGKDFYPLVRISPSLSDDSRFNPAVEPEPDIIVAAIIKVWNEFVAG